MQVGTMIIMNVIDSGGSDIRWSIRMSINFQSKTLNSQEIQVRKFMKIICK